MAPVRRQAAGLAPPQGPARGRDGLGPVGGGRHLPPLACGLVALALLVPLIVPMLSLHLDQEDIPATPKETTERQAFDLMARRS
jgi:hypothetical protein